MTKIFSKPKKKSSIDKPEISKTMISCFTMPISFILLIVVLVLLYAGDIGRFVDVLRFSVICFIYSIVYALPFINIALFFFSHQYYDFMLGLAGISPDAFTDILVWIVAIAYAVIGYLIFVTSIIMATKLIEKMNRGEKIVRFWSIKKEVKQDPKINQVTLMWQIIIIALIGIGIAVAVILKVMNIV